VSIRPRSLKAVQTARTRLRDLASAGLSQAQAEAGAAHAAAASATAELDRALDACEQRMRAASITGLIRISADVETHRAEARHAEVASAQASTAVREASEALARRERELRTVDRAIELALDVTEELRAADEQRQSDDLSGRRRSS
jgi:hypothetical protein